METEPEKVKATAEAIKQVETAIAEANRPGLSRRERRKACKWLAMELGVSLDRVLIPQVKDGGFTAVAAQIAHHRRKAGLVTEEPTTTK